MANRTQTVEEPSGEAQPEETSSAESKSQDESSPDLMRLVEALDGSLTVLEMAGLGLFIMALFFVLDVAASFFIPVVLALLFDRLFSPFVRKMRQAGLPNPVGAGVVVIAFVGGLAVGIYYLSAPAAEWIETAPRKLQVAEYKLRGLKEPLQKMQEAAQSVEKATKMQDGNEQETVQVEERSLSETLMGQTRALLSGMFIMIFLLYFLLASGRLFIRKLIRVLPQFHHRRNAVKIVRRTESDLSRYLGTMVLINLGLGVAVGGALYLLDMPNPALWGALAGLLNFIPYIGPLVNVTIVGLVAVVTFDSLGRAVIPPLAYLGLNAIESSLVTPAVMGWRLRLNPVVILLAVTFWTWLWGIPGGLLAVPMLTTFKIIADNVDVLAPIGEFLGR